MIAFLKMNSTLVLIDGGFLSKLSKYFGGGRYLVYDLISFAENLTKKENLNCGGIFYYTAPPFQSEAPTKDEEKRKEGYDKFVNKLIKKRVIVREGRCQKIITKEGEDYNQKGVDVWLTMDLMRIPFDYPQTKEIILIFSDSDFVPVIEYLKNLGLTIILYTHYSKKRHSNISTSNQLLNSVSRYVELTKQDFINAPLLKDKKNNKEK